MPIFSNDHISPRFVESPFVPGAVLSHLSGCTKKGDVQLAFHWVVPSNQFDESNYDNVSDGDNDEPYPNENDNSDYANPDDFDERYEQPSEYANPDDFDNPEDEEAIEYDRVDYEIYTS